MKTKELMTMLAFIGWSNSFAQPPIWQWAKGAGGTNDDVAYSVATDASGNVYVAGYFNSPVMTVGASTLTNADASGTTYDVFLIKYDASGNVIWVKSTGGSNDDYAYSVTVDTSGNVLMAGSFKSSSITFGSVTLNNANAGFSDIFLVKYDASGINVLWAKSAGGTNDDEAYSVTIDVSENVFVTGYFKSSSVTFGSITLNTAGSSQMFIVKYNVNGSAFWANSSSGATSDGRANSVTADASGNIIVAGGFKGSSITFSSIILNNTQSGMYEIFIVKYDPSGNVLWAASAGGAAGNNYDDDANSITTDASGNILIAGYFNSYSITFGSVTLNNVGGLSDMFVAKYDANGNALWAKSAGGSFQDIAASIKPDASGNIYVVGNFNNSSITFDTITLSNVLNRDIFIVKYDAGGNVIWAKSAGSVSDDKAYSADVDATGNIFVTGDFGCSTAGSTSLSFGTTTLNSVSECDVFIAKLNDIPTGVTEIFGENIVSIYPNPFSRSTTVSISGSQFAGGDLLIYNVFGQAVHRQILNSRQETLNLGLPAGIYFYKINNDKKEMIGNGKLMIQ